MPIFTIAKTDMIRVRELLSNHIPGINRAGFLFGKTLKGQDGRDMIEFAVNSWYTDIVEELLPSEGIEFVRG